MPLAKLLIKTIAINTKQYLKELIAIIFINTNIFFLFKNILKGEFIEFDYVGYYDWYYHAYRIKSLKEFGFVHWTLESEQGQDMWLGYQFIPHYISLFISNYFKTTEARAMVILIFIMSLVCFTSLYILIRSLNNTIITSVIYTILSTGVLQFKVMIGDFTTFIGYCCTPLLLLLIFHEKKNIFLYFLTPIALGLSIYIHPILCIFCTVLWGLLNLEFNFIKIGMNILRGIMFLCMVSFYTLPVYFYDGEKYINEALTTTKFVRQLLFTQGYGLMNLTWVVLGFFLLIGILILNRIEKNKNNIIISFVYIATLCFWYYISLKAELPTFLNNFQITRWTGFISMLSFIIGTCFVNFYIQKNILKSMFNFISICFYIFFIYLNFIIQDPLSVKYYIPITMETTNVPIQEFFKENDLQDKNIKLFAHDSVKTSYFYFGIIRTENSYYHFSQNPFNAFKRMLIDGGVNITLGYDDLINYFRSRGVKYVSLASYINISKVFEEPFTTNKATKLGTYKDFPSDATYYDINFPQIDAWEIDTDQQIPKYENYNKLALKTFDYKYLNDYFKKFALFLDNSNGEVKPITIEYPNKILIEELKENKKLLLFANYDKHWQSNFEDEKLLLEKAGPNYLLITNKTNKPLNKIELVKQDPKVYNQAKNIMVTSLIFYALFIFIYSFFKITLVKKLRAPTNWLI